jgi:hypothetical protein
MRTLVGLAALMGIGWSAGIAPAQAPAGPDTAGRATVGGEAEVAAPVGVRHTAERLLRMTEAELVAVYAGGAPGLPPTGYSPGTVILRPGSALTVPAARLLRATAWQGKTVTSDGRMVNRMFGRPAITAVVTSGDSLFDGRPSVVFDYSTTSVLWRNYRDEVREVSPGVYLGCLERFGRRGPTVAAWFVVDLSAGRDGR